MGPCLGHPQHRHSTPPVSRDGHDTRIVGSLFPGRGDVRNAVSWGPTRLRVYLGSDGDEGRRKRLGFNRLSLRRVRARHR